MSTGTKAIILTWLTAAAVYFAGNRAVQLWDRDEPRYAQCSRQMLESGDWIVPRLYDDLRFQKPPLIYWCQATAMRLFGSHEEAGAFAARFPSSAAMLITLIVLAWGVSRAAGIEQAAWTVFVFASSALTMISAKMCLTDSVLLLLTLGAQFCLYYFWRGGTSWGISLLLGVLLGLGGLTKGPFILGICATTAAALTVFHLVGTWMNHRRRIEMPVELSDPQSLPRERSYSIQWLTLASRAVVVLAIVMAIVTPWIVLVNRHAPEFLHRTLNEAQAHLSHGKEGHTFPPGYHFLLVWPMFFPWSLLLPLAIGVGVQHRAQPQVRFALAALVGPWLMVEFIGTKLPHYFLPAYPAMAFLVAFAIRQRLRDGVRDLQSPLFLISAGVWAIIVAVIGSAAWIAPTFGASRPVAFLLVMSLGSLAYAATVFALFIRGRILPAFVAMGLGMFICIGFAYGVYLPRADYFRLSSAIARVLREHGAMTPGQAKMVDYLEPSLAFYQGGSIREIGRKSDFLSGSPDEWPHWIVLTREIWNALPPQKQLRLTIVSSVRGWSYADRGRLIEVLVAERR